MVSSEEATVVVAGPEFLLCRSEISALRALVDIVASLLKGAVTFLTPVGSVFESSLQIGNSFFIPLQ